MLAIEPPGKDWSRGGPIRGRGGTPQLKWEIPDCRRQLASSDHGSSDQGWGLDLDVANLGTVARGDSCQMSELFRHIRLLFARSAPVVFARCCSFILGAGSQDAGRRKSRLSGRVRGCFTRQNWRTTTRQNGLRRIRKAARKARDFAAPVRRPHHVRSHPAGDCMCLPKNIVPGTQRRNRCRQGAAVLH